MREDAERDHFACALLNILISENLNMINRTLNDKKEDAKSEYFNCDLLITTT